MTEERAVDGIAGYKRVGERRFREVIGFYYDDFQVGDVFEHRPGRTVTETDNLIINLLCMNPSPLHIDAAYCAGGEWGRPLMSSLVTFAVVCGMSVRSTSGRAIANLGWDRIHLLAPVFAGDTLYAHSEITGKRRSASRAEQGIVTCITTGVKATGETVMTFERTFLVPTAEHGIEDAVGY